MEFIQAQKEYVKARPIAVGVFAMLATLSLGMALSFALGFASPQAAFAQAVLPPCCTVGGGGGGGGLPPGGGGTTLIPASCELHIDKSTLVGGGTVNLSWDVANVVVNTANIDNGVGSVNVNGGPLAVTVNKTTKFTMTVTGTTGDVTCNKTVTVTPPPTTPAPTCTYLRASQTSLPAGGGPVTLTWAASAEATGFTIDNGVGAVTPPTGGTKTVTVTTTTTFSGTATGAGGTSAPCTVKVTVPPPTTPAPACTFLRASQTTLPAGGGPITLTWAATNATGFTIDNGVGAVTPASGGTTASINVNKTTTFSGTATGAGGTSAPCTVKVTVTPPPGAPACTLTASPHSFIDSGAPTLAWTTTNAVSFSIDNAIGSVTPVNAGSTIAPTIATTTTYVGTATSASGATVTCTDTVTVTPGGGGHDTPACTLTADDSQVTKGDTTTLHWTTHDATSFVIDTGVGSVTPVSGGSTTTPAINGDTTFTGTASGPDGTLTCSVKVTVPTGGCTSNCGGGGHHSSSHPNVIVSSLEQPGNQPLSFVYLSEIPYTGLDLGPVGTFLYWLVLAAWSAALAYLVLFKAVPFVALRARRFGGSVSDALNREPELAYQPAPAPHAAPAAASHGREHRAPHATAAPAAGAASRGYSAYDGFRSFAQGGALSIDDIVKGLSRMPAPVSHAEESHGAPVEPMYDHVEPVYQNVEPIAAAPARAAQAEAEPMLPHVPAFIESLVNAEREAVFNTVRDIVRGGADVEAFLAQIACALDDAYRARLEGAPVHRDVKRITDPVATPVLEKLVTSLTSAVDSSYSVGITGAKLALTRALAIVGA